VNPRLLGKRWARRWRWTLRVVIGAPLIAAMTVVLVSRSPLVGRMVRDTIEPLMGGELSYSSAYITLDGTLIVEDLSLRAPGVAGEEGEVLHVKRAEARLDWSGATSGDVKPRSLLLDEPVFRVSQATTTGSVNLAELKPRSTGKPATQPPRIDVINGRVELGEHTPGAKNSYKALMQLEVAGAVTPLDPHKPAYSVRLHEQLGRDAERQVVADPLDMLGVGMVLDGQLDLSNSSASLRLLNVRLNSWAPEKMPTYLRDVWARLAIKGRIPETKFDFDPATGVSASLRLEHVSMQALIPTQQKSAAGADDLLTLRDVVGTITLAKESIRAELDAVVENQATPSHVSLDYKGLADDSPFRCVITTRGFRVDKNPEWLVFTPVEVTENLAAFSAPTAMIDGEVVIQRGPPTAAGAADLDVTGKMDLSGGEAAFHRVPYPFKNMTGHVEFDSDKITITRMDGTSESGAVLHATGWIAPPNESAEVSLHVEVKDIPIDERFTASLPASRREAVSFLFSREREQELRAAGLLGPGAAGEAGTFELGGRASLDITVHTPQGEDAPWEYTVLVSIPKAGFLPRAFPWPFVGENAKITLTEKDATVTGGKFRGVSGGALSVDAHVVLEVDGKPDIRPDVHVVLTDAPLDEILLSALPPHGARAQAGAEGGSRPADVLRRLKLGGTIDCDAVISSEGGDRLGLAADVQLRNGTAGPFEGPEGAGGAGGDALRLTGLNGRLRVDHDRIRAPRLAGDVWVGTGARSIRAGGFSVEADAVLREALGMSTAGDDSAAKQSDESGGDGAGAGGMVKHATASLTLSDFDAAAPVERLIAAAAPDSKIAAAIMQKRRERAPEGRVDMTLTAVKNDGEGGDDGVDVLAMIDGVRGLEFDALGERAHVDMLKGSATYLARFGLGDGEGAEPAGAGPPDAVWARATALIGVAGDAMMRVEAEGGTTLAPVAATDPTGEGLGLTLEQGRFESCAAREALARVLDADTMVRIDALDPRGEFGASLVLRPPVSDGSDAPIASVEGVFSPHSLEVRLGEKGERISAVGVLGDVRLAPGGAVIDGLGFVGDGWELGVQGRALMGASVGAGMGLDIGVWARLDSLRPGVMRLLPQGAREKIEKSKLHVAGPIEVTDLRFVTTGEGAASSASARGGFTFDGLSVDSALDVSDAKGRCRLLLERGAGQTDWRFDARLAGEHLTAAGLALTNLDARITSGREAGQVVVPTASAECYGGRITGSASIEPAGSGSVPDGGGERAGAGAYRGQVSLAGVRFAPILAAVGSGEGEGSVGETDSESRERGAVDAKVSFEGAFGRPETLEGLGSVRISGGAVLKMPFVLTLMQLSNFQLPAKDSLDYMQSTFRLAGGSVVFDDIALLSRTLAITGYGEMTWPGMALDLRFNSRASGRVPVLSDVVEAVRNEMLTTRISGTLMEPKIDSEPLTGTRRLIGSALGRPVGPSRTQSEEAVDRAARAERDRLKRPSANVPDARKD